ncbi:hypothetical protein SDJN02_18839, partial [Cucurbita argyrosperma subsp. argyrosperma]
MGGTKCISDSECRSQFFVSSREQICKPCSSFSILESLNQVEQRTPFQEITLLVDISSTTWREEAKSSEHSGTHVDKRGERGASCQLPSRIEARFAQRLEEKRKCEIVTMNSEVAHKRVGFKSLGEEPAIDRASNHQVP